MTSSKNAFNVLVASLMLSSTRAFGPRLEPLSHAHSYNHGCVSQLHASEAEQNYHDSCESLEQPDCEFDLVSAPFGSVDHFTSLFNNGDFDGTFPFLQDQADAMAFGNYEDNESSEFNIWENESLELCGDECKECEIPKDWFAVTPGEEIDVMKFLGVTRLKPLR